MRKWFYWGLVCLWIGMIVYFSRQPFQQQDLSPFLSGHQDLIEWVREMPHISFHYYGHLQDSRGDTLGFVQFMIRKTVHFMLYGSLGLFLLLAMDGRSFRWRSWLVAAILVFGIAGMDEFIQFHVGDRTGCFPDVVLDWSGFLGFSLVKYLGKK